MEKKEEIVELKEDGYPQGEGQNANAASSGIKQQPPSPDEGIDVENKESFDSGSGSESQGSKSEDFYTPVKNPIPGPCNFNAPAKLGKVRFFGPVPQDDIAQFDSPLRKNLLSEPLMCSTPLKRPELNEPPYPDGVKLGFGSGTKRRELGLPVKNLLSEFATCLDSECSTGGSEVLELIPEEKEVESGAAGGSDVKNMTLSTSVVEMDSPNDDLNENFLEADDEQSEYEIDLKRPKMSESKGEVWSLEEHLKELKVQKEKRQPRKKVNDHRKPEWTSKSDIENELGWRPPPDHSSDSGVFDITEGLRKSHVGDVKFGECSSAVDRLSVRVGSMTVNEERRDDDFCINCRKLRQEDAEDDVDE